MRKLAIGPGRLVAFVDDADGMVVTGAKPGTLVRVQATTTAQGQTVTCSGEFVADPWGTVETARDPSIGGDYTGVDPFGLLWSADTDGNLDRSDLRPVRVSVSAESGGRLAEASFSRSWHPATGAVRDVREPGVIGRLFTPPAPALSPGVVILAGSDGGLGSVAMSALLSRHGMAALALAHWNYPGTPPAMKDIDVEIVGAACDWLRRQPGVRDQRPSVVGISRGGELALLAGSLEPSRVGSVVSLVGSGVAWGAFGPGSRVTDIAWRFRGEPLPAMDEDEDDPDACLEDQGMVARAEIPVENSERVLLVSGSRDGMWPSARLSAIAANRATRNGAENRVTHVEQADAGHGCTTPPGFAVPAVVRHPIDGSIWDLGGTREGNHAARIDTWHRLLHFLEAPLP
ncbi:MAG TPA: acyl-CoA thioesterase/bile acid-CoA:amino acid N-acyltransferase family protein [Mycobacteriales bacterium]|nr:acyl-CoA thioesterase/bile acid-CoA:amino acid N-acyltransferase family protein [Mycobacteriales bacterium]